MNTIFLTNTGLVMQYYDLTEYLRLSAILNYQLSAKQVNWNSISSIILGKSPSSLRKQSTLTKTIIYLNDLYGTKKRRLGSLAVLHPMRTSVLLSRATKYLSLLEILTALLHDVFEDFKPENYVNTNWPANDQPMQSFLENVYDEEKIELQKRMQWLTKIEGESYYSYIGRLLDFAIDTPEIVRVKLADRLDNSLDLRIDLEDPLQGADFFEHVFQLMFNNSYQGYNPQMPHVSIVALNGAERLYQLFKNTVLMSLIRQKNAAKDDAIVQDLFENLANASVKEAQRIDLHLFGYHKRSPVDLRILLKETMDYVQKGGVSMITAPNSGYKLDGLFMSCFDDPDSKSKKNKLAKLYEDKSLMIQAALAFIIIFLSFKNDNNFYIQGISANGVKPNNK